jgi:hypothetical protein
MTSAKRERLVLRAIGPIVTEGRARSGVRGAAAMPLGKGLSHPAAANVLLQQNSVDDFPEQYATTAPRGRPRHAK